MSGFMMAAFACHLVGVITMAAFAAVYLFRPTAMPYHVAPLGGSWEAVPAATQAVVLALTRAAGCGPAVAAIVTGVILFGPFREGAAWAKWAVPAIGLFTAGIGLYAMRTLVSRTQANPPIKPVVGGSVLSLAGLALSLMG